MSTETLPREIITLGAIDVFFSAYLIYALIMAIRNKKLGAVLLPVTFFFLFLAIITNYLLNEYGVVDTGEFAQPGLFIVLILASFPLIQKLLKLFSRMDVYERFVPMAFLRNLDKKDITEVKLGDSAEKNMSVLFSDIRNFTSLSEQMTPEENFKFINAYLSQMGPVIRRNQGFIDKFIGDAIMALFDTSADEAVKGAIGMMEQLDVYNEGRKRAGYDPVQIGVGINTGDLRIGMVGELGRMEATVISDAVNLASRIEGMTKVYGVSILISDDTRQSLRDPSKYYMREIDHVKVKGRTKPVTLWEVFDNDSPEIFDYKMEIEPIFDEARTLFHAHQFDEAHELFMDCLAKNPDDKTAELYIDRCKLFKKMGVDGDWEGVVRSVSYEKG